MLFELIYGTKPRTIERLSKLYRFELNTRIFLYLNLEIFGKIKCKLSMHFKGQ